MHSGDNYHVRSMQQEVMPRTHKYASKVINGRKQYIHRHVMEEQLGRELEPNEHVYHLNGDPSDNRPENLVIIKKKMSHDIHE